jgi:hypothetical protein
MKDRPADAKSLPFFHGHGFEALLAWYFVTVCSRTESPAAPANI